ncbi:MAG: hypothetical protein AAGG11_19865 [Pseudomonadota bacterium]
MRSAAAHHRPRASRWAWCTDPLFLLTGAVLLCTLLIEPRLGAGKLWDSAQLVGYLTFALLLYGFLDTGLGPRQRLHRHFGYIATLLLAVHGPGLLLTDPQTLHYLTWDAPGYMFAGLAALLLLLLLVGAALPIGRKTLHSGQPDFRAWHQTLGISIVLLALWHILGSSFYLSGIEPVLLAGLTMTVLLLALYRVRVRAGARYGTLLAPALAGGVFLALKWLPGG